MNSGSAYRSIRFRLNGREVSAGNGDVQTTLLDFLRGEGLTGAKEGCAEGECGACSVLVVAPHNGRSAYRAVNSCLMFLPMAAGHEVYTVESLAENGKLCEAQAALALAGGSQCGYCTPGFVVSLFAEQYRPDRTGPCDPRELGGNLCRCTGYRPIYDAARSLGPPPAGKFIDRLSQSPPQIEPFAFETSSGRFSRPSTVEECVSLLAADPEAKVVAGATDIGVESNLRDRRWPHLVSLDGIKELCQFQDLADRVRIGAGLSLTDVARLWFDAPQAVGQCLEPFASTTIRNRATFGGNLANASPIGDGAPLLLALDASLELAGPAGRRHVPLSQFFTGYRKTVLAPAEIITCIELPKPFPAHIRFYKVSKRRVDDISTVSACMAISMNERGSVVLSRFAFGGVAAMPILLTDVDTLAGQPFDKSAVSRVQALLGRTLTPLSDHRGSAAYRLAVAQSLVEKFFYEIGQEAHV